MGEMGRNNHDSMEDPDNDSFYNYEEYKFGSTNINM